ncbi:MAG TPA: DUF1697 domain-containing protein [Solirubrobacterales bacterium]|nr:DUF1697 domain-containing protein [Solirubrobacterales bacterium]
MDRYVAFLRGMNLGKRRITNEELRAHFGAMGFEEVATFRASGNVIFGEGSGEAEAKLATRVEKELDERLGYDVPVFLRSIEELAAIASHEPFDSKLVTASKGKLQVQFLAEKPSAKAKKEALALASDEDRLAIEGRELCWLPSGGISESELDLKALDRALGPGTMRTMGTVAQIAAKHC